MLLNILPLVALSGLTVASAAVLPRQAASAPKIKFHPVNGPADGVTLTGISEPVSGTNAYTSIPFAKPPIGDLRWKHPTPPDWTSSTFNATSTIPTCLQPPNSLAGGAGSANQEDCLYLNVYTPAGVSLAEADQLPVFVWVYGGAFVVGSAATYDPRVLMSVAQQSTMENMGKYGQPVGGAGESTTSKYSSECRLPFIITDPQGRPFVAVVPNYRLGVLGFPYGKEAAANNAGNLGIRDIQLALEWTRDNIASFGGDASQVTLAGQSAGAIISNLLLLQEDLDLFRSAIILSGGVSVSPIGPTASTWQEPFDLLAQTAGCLAAPANSSLQSSPAKRSPLLGLNVGGGTITINLSLPEPIKKELKKVKDKVKQVKDKIKDKHGNHGGPKHSATAQPSSTLSSTPAIPSPSGGAGHNAVWECLKTKSAEEILGAQVTVLTTPQFATFVFAPSIDGDLVPDSPHKLLQEGKFRAVPLLHGNVKDEGTSFVPTAIAGDQAIGLIINLNSPVDPQPETIAKVYELYPNDPALGSPFGTGNETFGFDPQWKRAAAVLGDATFQASRRWMSRQQVAHYPDVPVYSYLFNQTTPDNRTYLGVAHGQDVAYVFGAPLLGAGAAGPVLGANFTAADQAFTLQLVNYHINFIHSQSPNEPAPAVPAWPTYDVSESTGKSTNMLRLQFGGIEVIQDTYREEGIAYFNSEPDEFNLKRRGGIEDRALAV